jgi:type II secretory pathway component GspD/PulD (secretin)
LKYASAEAAAKELTALFAGQENCRFAVDSRKNAVIVLGTRVQHNKIQEVIRSLDIPAGEGPGLPRRQ